jgi:integrase
VAHVRKTDAGTWQARYRAPDGRERARNFRRKVEAEAFLATIEADKLRGEWTDPRRARITFGEWNTQVQQSRVNLAASTRDNDGSVIRSLILPTFGPASLSSIEPGHIRTWVADLVAAGYSPSTIRRAYTLLQLALEMAVDDGRLTRSPCRRIALPRIEQSEKRFLDIGEVEHLAETIAPRYRVFVITGAYTGLRPGELAALRTDRLDLRRRQPRVEEPIKTPAARRTVSFSRFLADELAAHLGAYPGDKNLIFTAPEGGRLDLRVFRRRFWYPAVRESIGEPMRPHDLRHTHVALPLPPARTPTSSPNDSDTPPSEPPTTSTVTCSKAGTDRPPTPSKPPGLKLSRTFRGLWADPKDPHWASETPKSPAITGDFEVWS